MVDVEQVIREYLPQIVHLSLATVKGDAPWVCEVHFAYDDDLNLYFRSKASRRHSQEIAENPKVAGNIVRQHTSDEDVLAVYFEGTAQMLAPGEEQNKAFKCLDDRFMLGSEVLEEASREDGHQFYKISVENYYTFGAPSGQKLQLEWNGGKK